MVKPPTAARPTKESLTHFVPWEIADPVPPWLHDHLDPAKIRELAVAQIRTQREILEIRAKAAANIEKLIQR